MYIIMNVMSILEIRGTAYSLPAKRSPSLAAPDRKCSPRTAQMQAHAYFPLGFTARPPGYKGAYALRRTEGNTAHFLTYSQQ
jgi:hypothetical protein